MLHPTASCVADLSSFVPCHIMLCPGQPGVTLHTKSRINLFSGYFYEVKRVYVPLLSCDSPLTNECVCCDWNSFGVITGGVLCGFSNTALSQVMAKTADISDGWRWLFWISGNKLHSTASSCCHYDMP